MKFRELKRKEFYIWFDEYEYKEDGWYESAFNSWVSYVDGELVLHEYWDYDEEYNYQQGYEPRKTTWKELKRNLKYKHLILFNTGRCHRCDCILTSENFKKKEQDFYFPFEYDIYYCEDCKQKQVDDYIAFMEKYDRECHGEEVSTL